MLENIWPLSLIKCFLPRNEVDSSHTSNCRCLWETCLLLLVVGVTCMILRNKAVGSETRQRWGSRDGEPQGLIPEAIFWLEPPPPWFTSPVASAGVGSLVRGCSPRFLGLQCGRHVGSRGRILRTRQLGPLGRLPNALWLQDTLRVCGDSQHSARVWRTLPDPSPAAISSIQLSCSGAGVSSPDRGPGDQEPRFLGPPRSLRWAV